MEEEFDLVECPNCVGIVDDPQYTCTTCWCEGGNGVIKVRRQAHLVLGGAPLCSFCKQTHEPSCPFNPPCYVANPPRK